LRTSIFPREKRFFSFVNVVFCEGVFACAEVMHRDADEWAFDFLAHRGKQFRNKKNYIAAPQYFFLI
jgi:hypothetical protein